MSPYVLQYARGHPDSRDTALAHRLQLEQNWICRLRTKIPDGLNVFNNKIKPSKKRGRAVDEGMSCVYLVYTLFDNKFPPLLALTTDWVRIPAWVCEKVASDLGLGGGFRRVRRFPQLLTTG